MKYRGVIIKKHVKYFFLILTILKNDLQDVSGEELGDNGPWLNDTASHIFYRMLYTLLLSKLILLFLPSTYVVDVRS